MKKLLFILSLLLLVLLSSCSIDENNKLNIGTSLADVSAESLACLECHTRQMPGIVNSWQHGVHAENAVGCFECHNADIKDPDSFEHNGFYISQIVSPKDCGSCHDTQSEEFLASHHSKAGEVLGSLDNYLGEVVEGLPASISGCQSCHGSVVKVDKDGHPTPETWPNYGIGRVNPDGTSGSCAACHFKHNVSKKQARSPETCGKCHLGPDHPHIEIYTESKHGNLYAINKDKMNMDSDKWVVGKDYSTAPTCATCHISATRNQPVTHEVGARLSINLRAPISKPTKNAAVKRKSMKDVCMSCHSPSFVKKHYTQLDAGIVLYNDKFAIPATEVMTELRKDKLIDKTPFNEKIEWAYWHLWHHEGRRARAGLAMMGPDYVQWHGFYEVAERFYFELTPEAEHLKPGIMDKFLSRPEHAWFRGKMTKEVREEVYKKYKKLYK